MFMERDDRVRDYINPDRVLWTTGDVEAPENLLKTDKEVDKFIVGYKSVNVCNVNPL